MSITVEEAVSFIQDNNLQLKGINHVKSVGEYIYEVSNYGDSSPEIFTGRGNTLPEAVEDFQGKAFASLERELENFSKKAAHLGKLASYPVSNILEDLGEQINAKNKES